MALGFITQRNTIVSGGAVALIGMVQKIMDMALPAQTEEMAMRVQINITVLGQLDNIQRHENSVTVLRHFTHLAVAIPIQLYLVAREVLILEMVVVLQEDTGLVKMVALVQSSFATIVKKMKFYGYFTI